MKYLNMRSSTNFVPNNKLIEFINFYSPCNHQNTYGFLVISGGIEVEFA